MTRLKKARLLTKIILAKLIESKENGCKPIFYLDIKESFHAKMIEVKKAGIRARKKADFPIERIEDVSYPKNFKPIIGLRPATKDRLIEWLEDISKFKCQSEGIAEVYNDNVKKGKETKLITERKERNLLLSI